MFRPIRFRGKRSGGVIEVFLVPASRTQLTKIAKARKVRMKVGRYSGAMPISSKNMLAELLKATR